MRHKSILIIAITVAVLAGNKLNATPNNADGEKQNVIIFLVDDMGWMDCGVYGSQYYETPNIDRFAEMGMRFTQAYAANPFCSPTRAAIMTGRYPSRFELTSASAHLPANPDADLTPPEKTEPWRKMSPPFIRHFMPLEEITLAEVLKKEGYSTCHIGKWHLGEEPYYPEKQGFEYNVGGWHLGWPPSYFSPYKNPYIEDGPEGEYLTDRLTDEALQFIASHRDEPFYMNLWHYAVHTPFHAEKFRVDKYTDKIDPRGRQGNAVMAGMIESMDQSLGKLLDGLEAMDLLDRTTIIFTSDNGGLTHVATNGMPATNNYPLRQGKGNIHEGGIRVPCIIRWPGNTRAGSVSDEVICSIDFFPTILDMLKIDYSSEENPIDGKSLTPVLSGKSSLERDGIFIDFPHYTISFENIPSHAIINQDWKLIRVYGEGPDRQNFYELYDLKKDIKEEINLAAFYPEVVKELDGQIEKHLEEAGCFRPVKNEAYDPDVTNPKIGMIRNQDPIIK
jgi:arylsulfatase A-like enzyme